ncbi:uncharacterized protein TNCV_4659481 [Trichonephila clavipes]|nr:uncharacterized protein TNCV_4659481 [Trichonephila clavipes]
MIGFWWQHIPLNSATRKVVAKFKPKFEVQYRVLDVKNNNVVIWKAGKRLTINVDQVRIYRHRKCDETEIGTGSSDNGSLRDESSDFDRIQRRSNDWRDGKKKSSEVKRELEGKRLSFRNNQGEKHTNKTNKRGPLIRSRSSSWSEKDRMIKKKRKEKPKGRDIDAHHNRLPPYTMNWKKKRRVSTDHREEDTTRRSSSFQKRQRKRNDSPYIEKRTRSSNKNARRGEVIKNGKTRKGKERGQRNLCHWRSW